MLDIMSADKYPIWIRRQEDELFFAKRLQESRNCNIFAPHVGRINRNGRLAQLVQSVCLTSRGSGVRIPQRPRKSEARMNYSCFAFSYDSLFPKRGLVDKKGQVGGKYYWAYYCHAIWKPATIPPVHD